MHAFLFSDGSCLVLCCVNNTFDLGDSVDERKLQSNDDK